MNSIIEECLNSIECLVQRCPKEITTYIDKLRLLAENFMIYDPNYSYEHQQEDVDMEGWGEWDDDMDMGQDDDDTSWKVRRGAIKVLLAIIHSWPEKLWDLYENLST